MRDKIKNLKGIWRDLIRRCHDPRVDSFKRYGEKGIFVCDGIKSSYKAIVDLIGLRPDGDFSIDRIDNKGSYTCGACRECINNDLDLNIRWADRETQNRNREFVHKLKIGDSTLTPPEVAERFGIKYRTIKNRMMHGKTGLELIKETRVPIKFDFGFGECTAKYAEKTIGLSRFTIYSRVSKGRPPFTKSDKEKLKHFHHSL